MTRITRLLGAVLLALLVSAGAAPVTVGAASTAAGCGDTAGFGIRALSSLPAQAADTVDLISRGGPYPYPQDDQTFGNRERILPLCAAGYYREYTVETPGLDHRGARRFVTGTGGEFFYTADHYDSFVLVDVDR